MRSWRGLVLLAVAQLALHARGGVETVLAQANVRIPTPARRVPLMCCSGAQVPPPAGKRFSVC